jgi:hypothetical protein
LQLAAENGLFTAARTGAIAGDAGNRSRRPSGQGVTFSAVSTVTRSELSLTAALDVYFAGADLAPTSTRVYRQALGQLAAELGTATTLEAIAAERLVCAAQRVWGELGPATWNRNVAALRSFLRWSSRDETIVDLGRNLARRREPVDRARTSAIWRAAATIRRLH